MSGPRADAARFAREQSVMRLLQERVPPEMKQCFVPVLESGSYPNETPVFLMPMYEYGSLEQFCGKMDLQTAINTIRALAIALESAHNLGIYHNDIKAPNILLDTVENGRGLRPVIGDWGLAWVDDGQNLTSNGTPIGTLHGPHQNIPENPADGGRRTPQYDIYALGRLFYILLAPTEWNDRTAWIHSTLTTHKLATCTEVDVFLGHIDRERALEQTREEARTRGEEDRRRRRGDLSQGILLASLLTLVAIFVSRGQSPLCPENSHALCD
eukprot:TRINITY_DN39036_c0_g1_i1.p1 TRINITY_DN39036_c0_g1~~TRINITY_DN39036_c0_g1_i1.p1  ORF type:complete len:307 (-),score=25.66 TRINITY_DN39036_c0_g1_i1:67-876(-)